MMTKGSKIVLTAILTTAMTLACWSQMGYCRQENPDDTYLGDSDSVDSAGVAEPLRLTREFIVGVDGGTVTLLPCRSGDPNQPGISLYTAELGGQPLTKDSAAYKDLTEGDPVAKEILDFLIAVPNFAWKFKDLQALKDFIKLRKAIVAAAKEANKRLRFTTENLAVLNGDSDNWERCPDGVGIQLKPGRKPSDGIREIFEHPERFGFDCATMQIVICLKAMLDVLGAEEFDRRFSMLFLRGYEDTKKGRIFDGVFEVPGDQTGWPNANIPGDRQGFRNPDADAAAWLNENTIYLGNGLYFCPGLHNADGSNIFTEAELIAKLREHRNDPNSNDPGKQPGRRPGRGLTQFPRK